MKTTGTLELIGVRGHRGHVATVAPTPRGALPTSTIASATLSLRSMSSHSVRTLSKSSLSSFILLYASTSFCFFFRSLRFSFVFGCRNTWWGFVSEADAGGQYRRNSGLRNLERFRSQ